MENHITEVDKEITGEVRDLVAGINFEQRDRICAKLRAKLMENVKQGAVVSAYYHACMDAKGLGLEEPNFINAGDLLMKMPEDFSAKEAPIHFQAEELARVCELHDEVTPVLLKNAYFEDLLCPEYLARVASAHEDTSEFVLEQANLTTHLDGFDLARMGSKFKSIADLVIKNEDMAIKLDSWNLSWLSNSSEDAAKYIFSKESLIEILEPTDIVKVGSKYKGVAKLILQNKKLYSKLQVEQLKRLRGSHDELGA